MTKRIETSKLAPAALYRRYSELMREVNEDIYTDTLRACKRDFFSLTSLDARKDALVRLEIEVFRILGRTQNYK